MLLSPLASPISSLPILAGKPLQFVFQPLLTEYRDVMSHRNPAMESKIRVEEHLEKLSSEGKISYTAIAPGIFFNWGEYILTQASFGF